MFFNYMFRNTDIFLLEGLRKFPIPEGEQVTCLVCQKKFTEKEIPLYFAEDDGCENDYLCSEKCYSSFLQEGAEFQQQIEDDYYAEIRMEALRG